MSKQLTSGHHDLLETTRQAQANILHASVLLSNVARCVNNVGYTCLKLEITMRTIYPWHLFALDATRRTSIAMCRPRLNVIMLRFSARTEPLTKRATIMHHQFILISWLLVLLPKLAAPEQYCSSIYS
jgi:hypothetical protein